MLIACGSVLAQNTGYNPSYVGSGNGCKTGGTCYYVDYVNGSNSNNGLSKTTAWKSAPGMACNTPPSHTYSHTDEIIFKGGVTWPASCYQWAITTGGSTTANSSGYPGLYIGYDPTWNNGTVNSVRVVDPGSCTAGTTLSVSLSGGGGSGATATAQLETGSTYAVGDLEYITVTSPGSGYTSNPTVSFAATSGSCSAMPTAYADIYSPILDGSGTVFGTSSNIPQMIYFTSQYATLDHFEIAHYLWYAGSSYTGGSPNMIGQFGSNQEIRNIYLHDFGMSGTYTSALTNARNAAQTAAIYGGGYGSKGLVTNSILNNYESEAHGCVGGGTGCASNVAIYCAQSDTNNVINVWRGGIYTCPDTTAGYLVAGNKMWAILSDPNGQHPDAMYFNGGTVAYNNVLRDIFNGSAAFYIENIIGSGPQGTTQYMFNNVMFGVGNNGSGTSTPPIGYTAEFFPSSASSVSPASNSFAFNNTFYSNAGNSYCINSGQYYGNSSSFSSSFNYTLRNNYCVTSQAASHWYGDGYSGGNGLGTWNGLTGPNTAATRSAIDATTVIHSPSVASTQGYNAAHNFAPMAASNDTVTFANGSGSANLTSLCSTSVGGVSLAPLCSDINGNPRPATGGWQAGAYHFSTSQQTGLQAPATVTYAIH